MNKDKRENYTCIRLNDKELAMFKKYLDDVGKKQKSKVIREALILHISNFYKQSA